MRHDPAHEAERWLKQAQADLETAQILERSERYYMCCFLCHQATEKALKAYLYGQGAEIVLGHSIATLAGSCMKHDAEFDFVRSKAKNLDQYYIEARYPNGLPDGIPAEFFERDDAAAALQMAEPAIDFITEKLHAGR